MTLFNPYIVLLAGCLAVAGCAGERAEEVPGDRLPHVLAPMDTAADTMAHEDGREPGAGLPGADSLDARWQAPPPNPLWPPVEALAYVPYRNDAFDFSIAYPDTLLKPTGEIGMNHGREFASADERIRMLAYAVEEAGLQMLEQQYQDHLDDPEARVTYRVSEDDWYVVAGARDGRKFYEKSILRNGTLKTFHIQYDSTYAPYLDAVTAIMATSFKG